MRNCNGCGVPLPQPHIQSAVGWIDGYCPACLRKDAELGRKVRAMPIHTLLAHAIKEKDGAEWLFFCGNQDRAASAGETPEEALNGVPSNGG